MHLFGLNWQLQELDNQLAFENGAVGKMGPTQSSMVTALAADGEKKKNLNINHGFKAAVSGFCLRRTSWSSV